MRNTKVVNEKEEFEESENVKGNAQIKSSMCEKEPIKYVKEDDIKKNCL